MRTSHSTIQLTDEVVKFTSACNLFSIHISVLVHVLYARLALSVPVRKRYGTYSVNLSSQNRLLPPSTLAPFISPKY